jgi:DNA-binding transcriptional ArsR family regulator
MKDGPHIARIAALIGDQARAEVLTALMADRALTATELATVAGVSRPTISAHLAKLREAGSSKWKARAATATFAWPTATWRSCSSR